MEEPYLVATDTAIDTVKFYQQYGNQIRENLVDPYADQPLPRVHSKLLGVLLQDISDGENGTAAALGRSPFRNSFTIDMLGYFVDHPTVDINFQLVIQEITRNSMMTITSAVTLGTTTVLTPATTCIEMAQAIVAATGNKIPITEINVIVGARFFDPSLVLNTCAYKLFIDTAAFILPPGTLLTQDTVYGFPGVWYLAFGGAQDNRELWVSVLDDVPSANPFPTDSGVIIANKTLYYPTGDMFEVCEPFMTPYMSPIKAGTVVLCDYVENNVGYAIHSASSKNFVYQFANT